MCGLVSVFALVNLGLAAKELLLAENVIQVASEMSGRFFPILFAVVGALIISRQPGNLIGWLLMAQGIFLVAGTPVETYIGTFTAAP
ncbi:MAG: hypothetical protein EHM70_19615, partial [Chloroflexota bacterium]